MNESGIESHNLNKKLENPPQATSYSEGVNRYGQIKEAIPNHDYSTHGSNPDEIRLPKGISHWPGEATLYRRELRDRLAQELVDLKESGASEEDITARRQELEAKNELVLYEYLKAHQGALYDSLASPEPSSYFTGMKWRDGEGKSLPHWEDELMDAYGDPYLSDIHRQELREIKALHASGVSQEETSAKMEELLRKFEGLRKEHLRIVEDRAISEERLLRKVASKVEEAIESGESSLEIKNLETVVGAFANHPELMHRSGFYFKVQMHYAISHWLPAEYRKRRSEKTLKLSIRFDPSQTKAQDRIAKEEEVLDLQPGEGTMKLEDFEKWLDQLIKAMETDLPTVEYSFSAIGRKAQRMVGGTFAVEEWGDVRRSFNLEVPLHNLKPTSINTRTEDNA